MKKILRKIGSLAIAISIVGGLGITAYGYGIEDVDSVSVTRYRYIDEECRDSGWCYWNDLRNSFFELEEATKFTEYKDGTTTKDISISWVKTGCCFK